MWSRCDVMATGPSCAQHTPTTQTPPQKHIPKAPSQYTEAYQYTEDGMRILMGRFMDKAKDMIHCAPTQARRRSPPQWSFHGKGIPDD